MSSVREKCGDPEKVYAYLDKLNINYNIHKHQPVFTTEDALSVSKIIPGSRNKTLFLRNNKGDQHYLVSIPSEKRLDLKQFRHIVGTNKLSFGSEEKLWQYLQLTPGSVSPYGLINDIDHHIQYFIDQDILALDEISFHPNLNNATITVSQTDFNKFLDSTGSSWLSVEI